MKLFPLAVAMVLGMLLTMSPLLPAPTVQAADVPAAVFSKPELARMLAPIALYPDALLSQILMASTYPIEVIEADRWVRNNTHLRSDALDRALVEKDWDPSVKAICQFPSILALMSERITETTNLGNAFLAQEDEVMDMIQELRAEAYARGNLNSTSQQRVVVRGETLLIEPVDTRVIYVPYYDPLTIYGTWWYPAYRPYYWGPPGVSLGVGLSFWPGVYFGYSFSNWCYFDWHHRHIYVDVHKRPRYTRHDHWYASSGRWQHSPAHRRGVVYYDRDTARRFGQPLDRADEFRRGSRGSSQRQDLERDRNRRGDERPGIDRGRSGASDTRLEHGRQQEQPRIRQEQTRSGPEQTRVRGERPPVRQQQLRSGQEPPRIRQEPIRIEKPRNAVVDDGRRPAVNREGQPMRGRVVERVQPRPVEERQRQTLEPRRGQVETRQDLIRRGQEGRSNLSGGERSGFYRQERQGDLRDRGQRSGGNWGGRGGGGRGGGGERR